MISWVAQGAMVVLAFVGLGCIVRLFRGPTTIDRVVALDALGMVTIALMLIGTVRFSVAWTIDAALLIALIVFVGTLACARWIERNERWGTKQEGDAR